MVVPPHRRARDTPAGGVSTRLSKASVHTSQQISSDSPAHGLGEREPITAIISDPMCLQLSDGTRIPTSLEWLKHFCAPPKWYEILPDHPMAQMNLLTSAQDLEEWNAGRYTMYLEDVIWWEIRARAQIEERAEPTVVREVYHQLITTSSKSEHTQTYCTGCDDTEGVAGTQWPASATSDRNEAATQTVIPPHKPSKLHATVEGIAHPDGRVQQTLETATKLVVLPHKRREQPSKAGAVESQSHVTTPMPQVRDMKLEDVQDTGVTNSDGTYTPSPAELEWCILNVDPKRFKAWCYLNMGLTPGYDMLEPNCPNWRRYKDHWDLDDWRLEGVGFERGREILQWLDEVA